MDSEYEATTKKLVSTVENTMHRSGYGDMHAYRDTLMNAEHVAFLRRHDVIDINMAEELIKPNHRERKYTAEYLGSHPDYTGVQPEMTALSTADRHQKQRDKEMEKFVKDFEAGQIDENGDLVPGARYMNTDDDDEISSENGSDSHEPPSYDPDAFLKLDASLYRISDPSDDSESSMNAAHAQLHDVRGARKRKSMSPSPAGTIKAPSPASQVSNIGASTILSRGRKRKYRVDPLQPLLGGEDYSQYKYYQLVAVCRERMIYSAGDTQEVRNCLIQDDTNIAQGLPRNIALWKRNLYKDFKHEVPDALRQSETDK